MRRTAPRLLALAALLLATLLGLAAVRPAPAGPPSVVLLTLDTTRADAIGARTPTLSALAARGTRWTGAVSPVPLTLPAHVSLLTGLVPPEHGIHDNGTSVLPKDVPTLASAFAARGYATAGFVASRVLDRRFGLDRGFQVYDDKAPAEQIGEYGYPERNARQMTDAALEWLAKRPAGKPFFLWVHYYDPHAPYNPPDVDPRAPAAQLYAGEVAYMDREIGRLLAALPEHCLIAAVGDHGEALGEHGERTHGVFLYHSTLHVPLIVAGPGVPRGKAIAEAAPAQRLASTLLRLAGAGSLGETLPGLGGKTAGTIYAESRFPLTAYGWSPLEAVFDGRWKLIVAPRPELYDLGADPGERRNLLNDRREEARRLKAALQAAQRSFRPRKAEAADPELARSLQSLGYATGSGSKGKGTIDPKDGVPMLAEFMAAKEILQRGDARGAVAKLSDLVRRSPGNIPFLTNLATAQLAAGDPDAAIATYRRAAAENPKLDFLHENLADAYARLGRTEEARKEYELTLELNPRFAAAWWGLADLAQKAGRPAEVRRILTEAVEAGTESVSILVRLAEAEAKAGDLVASERRFRQAVDLAPAWAPAWMVWGQLLENQGKLDLALERYLKAAEVAPGEPAPLLGAGRVLQKKGDRARARAYFERIVAMAPGSPEAREARRLLGGT
ncbi:MAG TPA: sulfatase-like hydrolase/transferase [Thermoanaerobaculia bacterium]|jgi:arylsulfatase A-like enzyme/Flp pilus assembly protein TadD|nr:sulfatase-like hydrolase/transferase [Thermoanaerobaculia bacterium]